MREATITRTEIDNQVNLVAYYERRLADLQRDLATRRALAADGGPAREAARIEAAFADAPFLAAVRALDAADLGLSEAQRLLRRCGGRRGRSWGGMTKLEAERRAVVSSREHIRVEVLAAFERERARVGLSGADVPSDHFGSGREHKMRSEARRLRESASDGGVPADIASTEARLAEERVKLNEMRARQIPDETLRALAAGLSGLDRWLLIRLYLEHYRPSRRPPADIAEGVRRLAAAGLVGPLSEGRIYISEVPLGEAVARLASETEGADELHFGSVAEMRKAFSATQRAMIAAAARTYLSALPEGRAGDVGSDLVEVGLPAEGVSYRLRRCRPVLARFIRIMGGGNPED